MATASEIKQKLQELSNKRTHLEGEVNEALARLNATGLGMEEPLVDSEGFPRADVDIAAIRTDRQKVRMLSNDHKELSNQMEALIHRLHALSRDFGDATPAITHHEEEEGVERVGVRAVAAPIAVAAYARRPFAMIDEVSQASPAEAAGLLVGDEIVTFGHISIETPNAIQAVASLLSSSEGRQIECVVSRGTEVVKLHLLPQAWEGRGLLGCHLTKLTR